MSIKKWPGAVVSDVPVVPTGPDQVGSASGLWTLDQQAYWKSQNLWPIAGYTINAWDISKAYYGPGSAAGDVSTAYAISVNDFDPGASSGETSTQDCFFSPDGTALYIVGVTTDRVHQYTLSTPWVPDTATYTSKTLEFSPQTITPRGIFINPDGDKLYMVSNTNVYQYTLSTPWDVSTGSYLQTLSVSAQAGDVNNIWFKPDGTKMYIPDSVSDNILEYNLSTPWNISTASYLQAFYAGTQDTSVKGLAFCLAGTKMYMGGDNTDKVYEYNLSTAWDVSTASFVQAGTILTYGGLFVKEDGSAYYAAGNNGSSSQVRMAGLGGFLVNAQEVSLNDLFFKPDGTKMYIIGQSGDDVNEYNLSTAWDVNTASYLQNFSVATEETTPEDVFFKPDGTKMYVLGSTGDDVNEYDLSTGWDISTASYLQSFSVAAQEIGPTGLFFKPDGTKMYVCGFSGDDVNEYNLSTAWDISTASYLQNFSVAAQQTQPEGICFSPDGTNMYISGATPDAVSRYVLSTGWDVSTASFLQSFSVLAQTDQAQGIFFKPDGSQFFIASNRVARILSYPISKVI